MTEIVRGADLIEPTVRQLSLYKQFGWRAPRCVHLPLALNEQGAKLSKQNHAPALATGDPRPVLVRIALLGQRDVVAWQEMSVEELLRFAVTHWRLTAVPTSANVNPAFSNASR